MKQFVILLKIGIIQNQYPKKTRIKKINSLYMEGHTIIYWTARGTVTGKDWSEMTKKTI